MIKPKKPEGEMSTEVAKLMLIANKLGVTMDDLVKDNA